MYCCTPLIGWLVVVSSVSGVISVVIISAGKVFPGVT